MDIARAREALEDLLKSPNNSTATRYYVKLALSHMVEDKTSTSITCPRCGKTSYHPMDEKHKYCGHCHMYHDDMIEEEIRAANQKLQSQ